MDLLQTINITAQKIYKREDRVRHSKYLATATGMGRLFLHVVLLPILYGEHVRYFCLLIDLISEGYAMYLLSLLDRYVVFIPPSTLFLRGCGLSNLDGHAGCNRGGLLLVHADGVSFLLFFIILYNAYS